MLWYILMSNAKEKKRLILVVANSFASFASFSVLWSLNQLRVIWYAARDRNLNPVEMITRDVIDLRSGIEMWFREMP